MGASVQYTPLICLCLLVDLVTSLWETSGNTTWNGETLEAAPNRYIYEIWGT